MKHVICLPKEIDHLLSEAKRLEHELERFECNEGAFRKQRNCIAVAMRPWQRLKLQTYDLAVDEINLQLPSKALSKLILTTVALGRSR
jgi:hypothetical protein